MNNVVKIYGKTIAIGLMIQQSIFIWMSLYYAMNYLHLIMLKHVTICSF